MEKIYRAHTTISRFVEWFQQIYQPCSPIEVWFAPGGGGTIISYIQPDRLVCSVSDSKQSGKIRYQIRSGFEGIGEYFTTVEIYLLQVEDEIIEIRFDVKKIGVEDAVVQILNGAKIRWKIVETTTRNPDATKEPDKQLKPWEQIPEHSWDRLAVELWWKGYTNKEIKKVIGGIDNPKTITTRLSELRQKYPKEVPTKEELRRRLRVKDDKR